MCALDGQLQQMFYFPTHSLLPKELPHQEKQQPTKRCFKNETSPFSNTSKSKSILLTNFKMIRAFLWGFQSDTMSSMAPIHSHIHAFYCIMSYVFLLFFQLRQPFQYSVENFDFDSQMRYQQFNFLHQVTQFQLLQACNYQLSYFVTVTVTNVERG